MIISIALAAAGPLHTTVMTVTKVYVVADVSYSSNRNLDRIDEYIKESIEGGGSVIGYGSWATALVHVLQENRQHIWWHIRNDEVMESLQTEGRNAKYLYDIEFDMNLINASTDINEVVRNSDIIIIAAPSAYLKSFLKDLQEPLKDKFILSATKGIIPDDYKTITEFFRDTYGLPYEQLGLISGPSHAEEVSRDKMSYLTVACTDDGNSRIIGGCFSTPKLHIQYSKDIYGIEYAGILKNIYALAGGIATGLGYGDNFRAYGSKRTGDDKVHPGELSV